MEEERGSFVTTAFSFLKVLGEREELRGLFLLLAICAFKEVLFSIAMSRLPRLGLLSSESGSSSTAKLTDFEEFLMLLLLLLLVPLFSMLLMLPRLLWLLVADGVGRPPPPPPRFPPTPWELKFGPEEVEGKTRLFPIMAAL